MQTNLTGLEFQIRDMAARMGHFAVEQLLKGERNQVICYRDSRIVPTPIEEALQMEKNLDAYMYRVAGDIGI